MMFPDWGETPQTITPEPLPLYTEWAVDWEGEGFAMRDGKPYTVTGDRALAIWVYKTLHTACERFQYTAWSHDYGNELGALIGYAGDRGILESLLERYIREALLVSPYLTAVDRFRFTHQGSRTTVAFFLTTVYEGFPYQLEVNLS